MLGYYFITDATLSRAGILSDVKNAVAAGVRVVQYRNKNADTRTLYKEASRLRQICIKCLLLINDRVDIALAVGADGVHLGQDDLAYPVARRLLGKNLIIGLTAHSLKEALRAQEEGADYVGVSPIFTTHTKPDAGTPKGVALLRAIRRRMRIPIIAIGGITLANAPEVIRAGADGICAISAVVTKPDVKAEITKFQRLFSR